MLFQKMTFERLFPAALSGNGLHIQTNFGFESAGKRYFDVTVPGRPRMEQGMTDIALLEKPNEWGQEAYWVGSTTSMGPLFVTVRVSCSAFH